MEKIVKKRNKLVEGFDDSFIEIWNQNLEIKIKARKTLTKFSNYKISNNIDI